MYINIFKFSRQQPNDWLLYVKQFGQQYYYSKPVPSIPTASAVLVSIGIDVGNFRIETEALSFSVYPSCNNLSDFEDTATWGCLSDGFNTGVVFILFHTLLLNIDIRPWECL